MSTLSSALKALSESFHGYEKTGLMLSPEAVQSVRALLAEAGTDAGKLERMLERRLKAGGLNVEPVYATNNVIPFQRLMRGGTA